MARETGVTHWTNTRTGKLPSKSRIGPDHEVPPGRSAQGKRLRNRQARRRMNRWVKGRLG